MSNKISTNVNVSVDVQAKATSRNGEARVYEFGFLLLAILLLGAVVAGVWFAGWLVLVALGALWLVGVGVAYVAENAPLWLEYRRQAKLDEYEATIRMLEARRPLYIVASAEQLERLTHQRHAELMVKGGAYHE